MISERFACGSSFLHRADPRIKIIGACILTLMIAISNNLAVLCTGLTLAIVFAWMARFRPALLVQRLTAVNVFVFFLWLTLLLSGGGETLYSFGPVVLSKTGMLLALKITLKVNAIFLLMVSLLGTSPITKIGRGLQQLGISKKLVLLLLTTYRYLSVIEQEFKRLRQAASLRCFQPKTSIHTYRTYSYLVGMTLIRSWDRAGRVHKAMLMRGFSGDFPILDTGTSHHCPKTTGLITATVVLLAIVAFFC